MDVIEYTVGVILKVFDDWNKLGSVLKLSFFFISLGLLNSAKQWIVHITNRCMFGQKTYIL